MNSLTILFQKIVEMSLTAGIVILIVLLVRRLLRGFPKSFAYMLWIVAAFRLAVPVSFDSDISIFNLYRIADTNVFLISYDGARDERDINTADQRQNSMRMTVVDDGLWKNADMLYQKSVSDDSANHAEVRRFRQVDIFALIWLTGIFLFASYIAVAQIRIRRKIRYGIQLYGNVYECDNIRSPFVYGLFLPKIYIPFRLNEVERKYVLMHENYHILRKDYLIKSFAYVLLVIYWFQPLVWIAFYMMCSDMEISCDEKIIANLNMDMRKEYSSLLLSFASNKRLLSANSLAFGEGNTMKRIRNVLQYKNPKVV